MNIITVTVSVVNLTSLGWIISQSTGLNLAAKSIVRANEAVAVDRQKIMHLGIKNELMFQKVGCIQDVTLSSRIY